MAHGRPASEVDFGTSVWKLPPLILHPFADSASSNRLVENARTALMMCGLLPSDGQAYDELTRRLIEGRLSEMRMLFFLGKDLVRWLGQCVECMGRVPELTVFGIREQSFGRLLTRNMPEAVSLKLQSWGVTEAAAIFSRAIGLNQVFREPLVLENLAEGFIRNYHRYADHLYRCWEALLPCPEITSANFYFDLYASGEYTKMLENEWGVG